jgi:phage-related minor tail protein
MHELDPNIRNMLERLQGTEQELDAFVALQRFRIDGLAGAKSGIDFEAKERLVGEARERLRDALRQMLG